MNVVDLFCGAGGFSYGFQKAGCNIVLGVDIEECRLKTYSRNLRCKVIGKDITKLEKQDIITAIGQMPIHIIVGSPPCEMYARSNPNKVLLKSDDESEFELSCQYYRVIKGMKPQFFVMENVPRFFEACFIQEVLYPRFMQLGYTLSYNQLWANDFGVPQRRERGFLIGNIFSEKINLVPTHVCKADQINLEDAIGDLKVIPPILGDEVLPVFMPDQDFSDYQLSMHAKGSSRSLYNHVDPGNLPVTKAKISRIKVGQHYGTNRYHTRSAGNEISKVITSRFGTPSADGETMHYELNRCLTIREAARIQSFDDSFIFDTAGLSVYTSRAMVGDAVPPLLAKTIAEKIIEVYQRHTLIVHNNPSQD